MDEVVKRLRQPAFGKHGRKVIAFFCVWEILALGPGSPVPTVSATVRRWPWFGATILALLSHHWFVEMVEAFEDAIEEAADLLSS